MPFCLGVFPVIVDVTALYTNIRAEGPEGGFQAFEKALETREDKTVPTWYLMELLKATINGNIFEFDDQLYRQCIGTAMGTRVAPTYACLYMSYFETEKILKTWSGTPPTMFKRYQYCRRIEKVHSPYEQSKSIHKIHF